MKAFTILTKILLVFSTILLCTGIPLSSLSSLSSSSSSSLSDPIQEKLDDKRDNENWKNFENIKRDIKFNGSRALDVYYDKENTKKLKPVVIFLFGGAWHSGSKVKFTNFGSLLQTNGYVAVLPNYVLFPKGRLEDMVDDVYKAIRWTFDHIKEYGGNPKRITLSGFSAGSHLAALTLLKSKLELKNKKVTLEPFPTLEKVVLLNGPYDFDDYSQSVKFLAKSDNSIVERLIKQLFRTKDVSPTDLLKPYDDHSFSSLGARKFVFFYTSEDNAVRESSAKNLMAQMKRVCPSVNIKYVYKEGYEHTTLTRGVRAGNEEDEDLYMSLIRM